MAKPIHHLKLSQRSLDEIKKIKSDIGLSKIGLGLIATGHVFSLITGNSGNASRVITISFSEWEDYQRMSDWGGLAGVYVGTIIALIKKRACSMALTFPYGEERDFWVGLAGDKNC